MICSIMQFKTETGIVWFVLFYNCTSYNLYTRRYILLFRYADNISVGDEVLVEGNDKLTPLRVINVSNIMMQGHYHNLFD